MRSYFDSLVEGEELCVVIVENANSPNVCILYPSDVTDEQLEKKWVRAEEGDYTRVADVR